MGRLALVCAVIGFLSVSARAASTLSLVITIQVTGTQQLQVDAAGDVQAVDKAGDILLIQH